jgi:hypothetical protein
MEYTGAALSLVEMDHLAKHRFAAAGYDKLPEESRKFLVGLTLDERGLAHHNGHYAGVDGCFALKS